MALRKGTDNRIHKGERIMVGKSMKRVLAIAAAAMMAMSSMAYADSPISFSDGQNASVINTKLKGSLTIVRKDGNNSKPEENKNDDDGGMAVDNGSDEFPNDNSQAGDQTGADHKGIAGSGFTAYQVFRYDQDGAYADIKLTPNFQNATFADKLNQMAHDDLGQLSARDLQDLTNDLDIFIQNQASGTTTQPVSLPVDSDVNGRVYTTGITSADNDYTVKIENMDLGWYLVRETTTPDGSIATRPFLVAIPSAEKQASVAEGADWNDDEGDIFDGNDGLQNGSDTAGSYSWKYDVTVIPKATAFWVGKSIININGIKENTDSVMEADGANRKSYAIDKGVNADDDNAQNGRDSKGKKDTVGEGDYVHYSIESTVPNFADTYFDDATNAASSWLKPQAVFTFRDYMSNGLTIQDNDDYPVKVFIDVDENGKWTDGDVELTRGEDFNVTAKYVKDNVHSSRFTNPKPGDETAAYIAKKADGSFDISEPDLLIEFTNKFLGMDRDATDNADKNIGNVTTAGYQGMHVIATYWAQVNDQAVMGAGPNGEANINDVYLQYSRNPYETKEITPDGDNPNPPDYPHPHDYDTAVYTYGVDIKKFTDEAAAAATDQASDDNSNTHPQDTDKNKTIALAGAQFKLYTDEALTKAVKYNRDADHEAEVHTTAGEPNDKNVQLGADFSTDRYANLIGDNKYDTESAWSTNENNRRNGKAFADDNGDLIVETDAHGQGQFSRLDAGTYYLKEIKSPAGYTLLTNPIKIEIRPVYNDEKVTQNEGAVDSDGLKIDDGRQYDKYTHQGQSGVIHNNELSGSADPSLITAVDKGVKMGSGSDKYTDVPNESYLVQKNDGATDGVLHMAVENHKGFTLPATGGTGIILILTISMAGIILITVLLMKEKNRNRNSSGPMTPAAG